MALFFLLAALLVISTLALLLPVFRRHEEAAVVASRTETNVAIAKAQASDFKNRLNAGEITAAEYDDEIARIEMDLARDIAPEDKAIHDTSVAHITDKNTGQWLLWPLAVVFPLAAGVLYLSLGTPAAIDPANRAPVAQQQQAPSMQEMVARINQHLEEEPNDPTAWFMLGRAHLNMGQYKDAEKALRKSFEIDENNIDVTIRLADAIGLNQNGSLLGEPSELLKSALEKAPDHPQGLWLYGMAQNESGDHAGAVSTWTRLLPLLGADEQAASEVGQLIASARSQLGASNTEGASSAAAVSESTQGADTPKADTANVALTVEVDVKEGFADGLPADTALFVYAKAVSGPPMPLAVVKHQLSDLPLTVTLSDAQAMIPNMKISAFDKVIVGARISKTGNPIAQAGDLFAEVTDVETSNQRTANESALKIVISETHR